MGRAKWGFRNYNTFIREARREYKLSLPEARLFYREVRDYNVRPAYGADVKRYKEELKAAPEMVVESMLYGAPGVIGPVVEKGDYPDDHELPGGSEIEMTADTYTAGAATGESALHVKIRIILERPMTVKEARGKLQRSARTGIVQEGVRLAWIDWRKPENAQGDTPGGSYLRDDAKEALASFYGAIHHEDSETRVEVAHEAEPPKADDADE